MVRTTSPPNTYQPNHSCQSVGIKATASFKTKPYLVIKQTLVQGRLHCGVVIVKVFHIVMSILFFICLFVGVQVSTKLTQRRRNFFADVRWTCK